MEELRQHDRGLLQQLEPGKRQSADRGKDGIVNSQESALTTTPSTKRQTLLSIYTPSKRFIENHALHWKSHLSNDSDSFVLSLTPSHRQGHLSIDCHNCPLTTKSVNRKHIPLWKSHHSTESTLFNENHTICLSNIFCWQSHVCINNPIFPLATIPFPCVTPFNSSLKSPHISLKITPHIFENHATLLWKSRQSTENHTLHEQPHPFIHNKLEDLRSAGRNVPGSCLTTFSRGARLGTHTDVGSSLITFSKRARLWTHTNIKICCSTITCHRR